MDLFPDRHCSSQSILDLCRPGTIARDKGVSVEIYELKRWKLPLILAGLVGIKTAGIEIKTPVLQCEEGRYFVGVGAVTDYDEPFKNNSIVLSISASF